MAPYRHRFVLTYVCLMLTAVVVLASLDALSPEQLFVLAQVILLLYAVWTGSLTVKPWWRRRLRWVIVVGLATFVYLVANTLFVHLNELLGIY